MTREEIEKNRQYQLTGAAIDYCRKEHPHYDGEALGEITDAFEAGAEWEHKKLVEKACEWLKENLSEGYDPDNYPMIRCYDIDLEDFIKEFRREMEE